MTFDKMAGKVKKLTETLSKLHYQNPEKCTREIVSLFNTYRGLQYFVDTFVFNDGTQKTLVKLEGTIPVLYNGVTYNFPVCIWLMDTYPSSPPTCFVKPTAEMQIRVSSSVDHSGKIYLPYLHSWDSSTSDLLTLIQVMISKFTTEPPVFLKKSTTQTPMTPYPTQPHMPVPGGTAAQGSNPVYPPASTAYPQNPLPYPAFPSYPTQYPPYPGAAFPPSYPQQNYPMHTTPYPPSPYPLSGSAMPSATSVAPTTNTNSGTITEEHIRASVLSALEDKMRRLLKEQSARSQDEHHVLQQLQDELTRGQKTLDDILERLAHEQEELDKNLIMLKDKEAELTKSVERLSDQEPLDVDEAVTPTMPLYKQILNAYAEEAALEDTIYYMGEALRRGVIDLEVFLKQVRSLSHKQFMQRALIQKCRLKAGLAG